jgi:hypothetical protein
MPRSTAKITQAEMARIFKAARKAGVNVRVEIREGAIITTTMGETASAATAEEPLSAEDELERWRRKRDHAHRA